MLKTAIQQLYAHFSPVQHRKFSFSEEEQSFSETSSLIRGREVFGAEILVENLAAAAEGDVAHAEFAKDVVDEIKAEMRKLDDVKWIFHGSATQKQEGDTYAIVPRELADVGETIYKKVEKMWVDLLSMEGEEC